MIVAGRREFYQNLTYHTDSGLLDIQHRDIVEITDNLSAHGVKFYQVNVFCRYKILYFL